MRMSRIDTPDGALAMSDIRAAPRTPARSHSSAHDEQAVARRCIKCRIPARARPPQARAAVAPRDGSALARRSRPPSRQAAPSTARGAPTRSGRPLVLRSRPARATAARLSRRDGGLPARCRIRAGAQCQTRAHDIGVSADSAAGARDFTRASRQPRDVRGTDGANQGLRVERSIISRGACRDPSSWPSRSARGHSWARP